MESPARLPPSSPLALTARRALAFIERDAAQQISYRMALALELASILIVAWGSLWSFVYQSLKIALYLGVGLLFGLSLSEANWWGAGKGTLHTFPTLEGLFFRTVRRCKVGKV